MTGLLVTGSQGHQATTARSAPTGQRPASDRGFAALLGRLELTRSDRTDGRVRPETEGHAPRQAEPALRNSRTERIPDNPADDIPDREETSAEVSASLQPVEILAAASVLSVRAAAHPRADAGTVPGGPILRANALPGPSTAEREDTPDTFGPDTPPAAGITVLSSRTELGSLAALSGQPDGAQRALPQEAAHALGSKGEGADGQAAMSRARERAWAEPRPLGDGPSAVPTPGDAPVSPQKTIADAFTNVLVDGAAPGRPVAATQHVQAIRVSDAVYRLQIDLRPDGIGPVTATMTLSGQQLDIEVRPGSHEVYDRLVAESGRIVKALEALDYDVGTVTILQPSAVQDRTGSAGQDAGSPASDGQASTSGSGRQDGRERGQHSSGGSHDQAGKRGLHETPSGVRPGGGLFI